MIEARRQHTGQGSFDDAWRQCAVIDEHVQQRALGDLAASFVDKTASFELTEVAMEADLAAEERPEVGFQGFTLHQDVRVRRLHGRRLAVLADSSLNFLLSLPFG